MEGHHLHHHHHHQRQQHQQNPQQQQQQQQQHQIQQHGIVNVVDVTDRFPQWSIQETKEFLMIRAELDQAFMETKRNKQLWEVISNKMKEKSYNRSPEQCKCKWKNLVTRYKGCETMEAEALRQQFPFYNELQAIFTARVQKMLWAEAEGAGSNKKKATAQLSSDDDDEGGNEESEGDHHKSTNRKKKKGKMVISGSSGGGGSNSNNSLNNLKEILEEFMRQQMQIEAQWMEAFEARENERRLKELEWRQTMEALENERIMMDQRWREREEQRRIREEARADKRDALINALLNKLRREEM